MKLKYKIQVCKGFDCQDRGSLKTFARMESLLNAFPPGIVEIRMGGCWGRCACGPNVCVRDEKGMTWYQVKENDAEELIDTHIRKGHIAERLLYRPYYDEE